jgi:hypothetical protein
MRNYWTCSKFADWLRGTAKGGAKTGRGWYEWEKAAKESHPVRYWIAEEGLDLLQNIVMFIPDRLHAIKYYINNRYITHTHCLTAHPSDIKRGEWCDVGYRFLPCLFNELRDYVEIELAWWHLAWNAEDRSKYNMPWWAVGWWRIRTWRCPEAGLDNLDWQSKLVWHADEGFPEGDPKIGQPTYQAEKAQEILALYKWWTEVYPNRPDPHDASGWSKFCDRRRGQDRHFLDFESETEEEKAESRRILDLCHKIEEQYEQEDEEMLIRLIKIRKSLWT